MLIDESLDIDISDQQTSDDDDCCSTASDMSSELSVERDFTVSSGEKKKKKKKKKKRSEQSIASKQEADKRFTAAVHLLNSNDEDGMWIRLSESHVQDNKMIRLCEALKNNKHVTSLDLSGNNISTKGAQVLAEMLESGGAPDLILLDLRGNPIDQQGEMSLDALQRIRKDLKIEMGELPNGTNDAVTEPSNSGDSVNGHSSEETNGFVNVPSASLVRKYFQVPGMNDDDLQDYLGSLDQQASPDAETTSQRVWEAVEDALSKTPVDIPTLSAVIREAVIGVEDEMANCHLPMLSNTSLDDLKPFTRRSLDKLALLTSVLRLVPPPVHMSYDRKVAQPTVGSHRLGVTNLVAQLLRAGCTLVYQRVAETQLLPRVVKLAFDHPNNNALHCAVLRTLKAALESTEIDLCSNLTKEGWGLEREENEEAPTPLQKLLAELGARYVNESLGTRPANIGYVIALSTMLKTKCSAGAEGQDCDHFLQAVLQDDDDWIAYVAPDGPLERLKTEQKGTLGGMKPERFDPDDRDFLLGGFGRVMTGQSLLAMLQGLQSSGLS